MEVFMSVDGLYVGRAHILVPAGTNLLMLSAETFSQKVEVAGSPELSSICRLSVLANEPSLMGRQS